MKEKRKYIVWALFSLLVIALFVFLQQEYRYHFFFIEQNFMFRSSLDYIMPHLAVPGGLANMVGEFLIQFYMFPYAGAAITTALIALVALLINALLRQINSGYSWLLLACIPALSLFFLHFDFNYKPAGTVAFLLMLIAAWGGLVIKNDRFRFAYNLVVVSCLFWCCGSVFVLYALLMVLYEFGTGKPLRYWSLLLVLLVGILGEMSVRFALIGEYKLIFLPDMFYHTRLQPKSLIYFSHILLILLYAVALWLKPVKEKKLFFKLAELTLPFVFVLLFAGWGLREYGDEKAQHVKKLDYFSRTGQWDEVINESRGSMTNYLYICYLNLALAEKGQLAERMFLYDQRGVDGLLLKWNKTFSISVLLSDVYYSIGNVALAQEMAFEASVSVLGSGNPRMLKRLVETNIIYGEYNVAGKYIDLLEQTAYYKKWAREQRRFLYNDAAVEEDHLLGEKRRGLLVDSYLSNTNGLDRDLINLAEHYPANRNPIEYLGGLLLLAKDLEGFKTLLETYYGTDVLPVLPNGFQEAVIILSEKMPEEWAKYRVGQAVIDRFGQYRKSILANKNNQALPQLMARDYGNTYWFYFMFK